MAQIIFYEKPGCVTNARQRRTLEAAGHTVISRNLLTEPWTGARLLSFFRETPVPSWFNPAAPAVKSSTIDPAATDQASALALMLADPILIRRPLLEAEGQRGAGFDLEGLASWLGLVREVDGASDLQNCTRSAPCPYPDTVSEPEHP